MKRLRYFSLILLLIALVCIVSCDSECNHKSMTEKVIPPTCTEYGRTVYECDNCDYSYSLNVIDPTGHTLTENKVSSTCTDAGYTEYSCDCGYTYTSNITAPYGHDKNGGSFALSPTCTDEGYTHYACSRCGYEYDSNFTAPTGHSYTEESHFPSCEEYGYTVFTCTCGDSFTVNGVAPKGHTIEATITYPTCTEYGYTTYSCSSCDYSYTATDAAPVGHTYNFFETIDPTCTEKGAVTYVCDCGESYTATIEATGHDFSRKVTMPTLSDMGSTRFECNNCDFGYTGDYTFFSDILKDAYANNTEPLAKGIDISYHNYNVDSTGNYIPLNWDAIKAAGINYVIIRAGDAAIGIDPTFEQSYNDAKAAGLDVGVYFYTRATSVSEIILEANLVLSVLDGKQFEYPIYLDLEDDSLASIPSYDITEMCVEFFTALQRAGYYTGLYVNEEWLKNHVQTDIALSKFDIWYARYPALIDGADPIWSTEQYGNHLGMWQYSDSGTIDGIEETVFDFNFAYKDYPVIIEEYGFNGFDSDVVFIDSDKSFVWVIYENAIKVRSKSDYFTNDDYDASLDIIGYADYGSRFEIIEITEYYTAILYEGDIAYISANPTYVSFNGLYTK